MSIREVDGLVASESLYRNFDKGVLEGLPTWWMSVTVVNYVNVACSYSHFRDPSTWTSTFRSCS